MTKLNKTFARRVGKKLSASCKNLLNTTLPNHILTPEFFDSKPSQKIFLEIGFGMGEHLLEQMKLNPDSLFIGIEAYLNGIAGFLKKAAEKNLTNFLIWPDDLDMILMNYLNQGADIQNNEDLNLITNFPSDYLNGIYILFPDPWPKNRHHKKRLFNIERFRALKNLLKPGGFIVFASDIEDYFKDAETIIADDKEMRLIQKNRLTPHTGYIQTKYHQKALMEGREAYFLEGIKI